MPIYQYQAVCKGQKTTGYVTADTPARGRRLLRERGLQIIGFEAAESTTTATRRWSLPRLRIGRDREAIDEATGYLAMLLRVGVPLTEALNIVIRQASARVEPVLRRLTERVNAGADLAQALAEQNKIFDSVYVGIVRVGEISGMLDECLERLVRLRRRQHQLRQRIQGAMAYPMIVAVVGLVVVLFLMTFVVPRITWVLKQSGRSLPLPTRILLIISDAVRSYWWLGLAIAVSGFMIVHLVDRQRLIQAWIKRQVLRIPIMGPLAMKAAIAQAAAMLHTMLRSGLTLDEALVITRKSTSNVLLQEEFKRMLDAMRSGRPLIDQSRTRSVLPPVVVHMLTVGEQTGQLEEMLEELTNSYDAEVDVAARQAVSLLEPILIVIMSCIVGFIVLATILPILRISGSF